MHCTILTVSQESEAIGLLIAPIFGNIHDQMLSATLACSMWCFTDAFGVIINTGPAF
jgi:hypothetical protein